MTTKQLAELFVEDESDSTMGIHTQIEALLMKAFKSGYECAVEKTSDWLEGIMNGVVYTPLDVKNLVSLYLKEIQL